MAMSKWSTLPLEIVDMFIDDLSRAESLQDLRNTCIVSRACVPRCRKYLFRRVRVGKYGMEDYSKFADFLRREALGGGRSVIESLNLFGNVVESKMTPLNTIGLVVCILSLLPRLKKLELTGIRFHSNLSDPMPSILPPLPKLDRLQLYITTSGNDTASDPYNIIRLFPEIDHLHLYYSVYDETDGAAPAVIGPNTLPLNGNLKVRVLSMSNVPLGLHNRIMYDTSIAGSVRSVAVECGVIDEALGLSKFLSYARDGIEALSIDLTPFLIMVDYDLSLPGMLLALPMTVDQLTLTWRMIDEQHMLDVLIPGIKACTALREFDISLCFCPPENDEDEYDSTVQWNCLIGLLSELADDVEHVTIKFMVPHGGHYEFYHIEEPEFGKPHWWPTVSSLGLDWNALKNQLERLEKLQELTIQNCEGTLWNVGQEDEAFITEELGTLSRILKFEDTT
ncbi:hypothetical protein PHLCEN_2v13459 [Hermanssonia centrifuga]|uniref:F-box domain-containing protein n=1 Tax=Hermanssonia centrifuga TaxID=98765 RepID=A0A2R6NE52_9APHY|nr:hypothetical protein PHLCEN_2v13459 [Hermanssonia centrifuga]